MKHKRDNSEQEALEEKYRFNKERSAQEPANLNILREYVLTCYRLNKYSELLEHCDQVLATNETLAWPHVYRSYVYRDSDKMDLCKAEAKLALAIDSSDWETNFWWGTLLCTENSLDVGIGYLKRAASINSNNWYLYNNLAKAYHQKGDMKNYYGALRQKNRLKPNALLWISIQLGLMFMNIGWVLLIYYLVIALTYWTKFQILLIIPIIITILWVVAGVLVFFSKKLAGAAWVIVGLFNGLAIVFVANTIK